LVYANTTRHYQFDPLNTDAINLGDYFFMKSQLEHYDVPMSDSPTSGRAGRASSTTRMGIALRRWCWQKRACSSFFIPLRKRRLAPRQSVGDRSGGYVEGDGWAGAVLERDGVCFMIAMHGNEEELRSYLSDPKAVGRDSF
jgi:hypothetical protein